MAEMETQQPAKKVVLPEQFRKAKILVVDDNATNVMVMERLLKSAGYENVFSETDSRKVVDRYLWEDFDLILLDIRMPHLDGHQVMAQLKEVAPKNDYVPILILTAQTDVETRQKAIEGGARDFITKPFERHETLNRIYNMLDVRLMHNELRDQNVILEEKVRERTHEIEDTRLQIVRRLGRAAEFRDNETGMHVIRMSHACSYVAKAAGLSEADCELILTAAPMHDIGKIGIPDNILLKPGKLTAEEWDIMKTHSQIGADLLSGHHSELLETAQSIALTHHEKWDGGGYPNGLAGEDIPLFGRITAICDVFDALTSDRPYKKAWPVEDAVAEIKNMSGRHFDPSLVPHFLDILPKILETNEKFTDKEE
jgi:putative two-component system response regulator